MRILLCTGKGGVGKTTLAAATGAALAALGRKTLVVSTDPAHSLGDAFGHPLGAEPSEVDTLLSGVQVDSRTLVDATWERLRGELRTVLAGAGLDTLDAEELTVLPGVDELLALTEVRRLAGDGPWETVVVDCGPTAETLRLLALPEAVSGYLTRVFGPRGRVTDSVRRLGTHLDGLRALLTDPSVTTVRLVLTPERVVVAEARRTLSSLALRGIAVDGVIANRLMPAPGLWRGGAASWLRTRRTQQDAVLAELAAAGIAPVARVEHRAVEPVGLPALLEIAA
ncbi:ArsA family ATPase, partial [Amycolatopsis mediterranei]